MNLIMKMKLMRTDNNEGWKNMIQLYFSWEGELHRGQQFVSMCIYWRVVKINEVSKNLGKK